MKNKRHYLLLLSLGAIGICSVVVAFYQSLTNVNPTFSDGLALSGILIYIYDYFLKRKLNIDT